jgi:hypothetical protein
MKPVMASPPEDRLLIALAQKSSPERVRGELLVLSKDFNWDRLVQRSLEEDVYPMVYRNLTNAGTEYLPRPALDNLKQLYEMNVLRVDILRNELREILKLLAVHVIQVIPLKGLALAESLYGDSYLRSSVDIDILVRQESIPEAVKLLMTLGYSSELFDTGQDFKSNVKDHLLCKRLGSLEIVVELHWAIMWGSTLDRPAVQRIWDSSREKDFLGTKVRSLSPEWDLIFLAGHAARSLWGDLKLIVDVGERADKKDIDWTTFWKMSAATGWDHAVRWSLQSSRMVLGRPVVAEAMSPPFPRWVAPFPAKPSRPLIQMDEVVDPRLLDRPSARLRFFLLALLTPRSVDRHWIRLPRSLNSLYYFLRPVRLASRVLGRMARQALKVAFRTQ